MWKSLSSEKIEFSKPTLQKMHLATSSLDQKMLSHDANWKNSHKWKEKKMMQLHSITKQVFLNQNAKTCRGDHWPISETVLNWKIAVWEYLHTTLKTMKENNMQNPDISYSISCQTKTLTRKILIEPYVEMSNRKSMLSKSLLSENDIKTCKSEHLNINVVEKSFKWKWLPSNFKSCKSELV